MWCWIDAFKLWYWRRLEGTLDSKEIKPVNPKRNRPWIFTGRTDTEAEASYILPPDIRANSLEKTLVLGNIEGKRRRGWRRMIWLDGITDLMDMSFSKLRETVKDRETCYAAVHGVAKSKTRLSDLTELKSWLIQYPFSFKYMNTMICSEFSFAKKACALASCCWFIF